MYAVAGNTTFIALLAMQGESMVIDLREEPDVEGGQNINPLGAALWTCMDGLYAATDITTLLQLATTNLRRTAQYERCVLYSIGNNAMTKAIEIEQMQGNKLVHASQGGIGVMLKVVAESREQHILDAKHPIYKAAQLVEQVCSSEQAVLPFKEENLRACIEPVTFGSDSSNCCNVTCSTLFAASEMERSELKESGLGQVLLFPLRDAEGQCWGLIAAYNYAMHTELSLGKINACESISSTLCSKMAALDELRRNARKSKLHHLHAELIEQMQQFKGVDSLRGLVTNPCLSLLNVLIDVQVLPSSPNTVQT